MEQERLRPSRERTDNIKMAAVLNYVGGFGSEISVTTRSLEDCDSAEYIGNCYFF